MVLAVDVGNSGIKLALFQEDLIQSHFRITTVADRSPDEYRLLIRALLEEKGHSFYAIERVVFSSVVPRLVETFQTLFQDLKIPILVVGPGVKTGMKIRVDNPSTLGTDLVCNAVAAYHRVQSPCIAVAFGTALTFTGINEKGEILGVSIAPGMQGAIESLVSNTAQLQKFSLKTPASALGTNSVASLQAGFMIGFEGMVEAIIKRMKEELGPNTKVISTGYEAPYFSTPHLGEHVPFLTVEGLRLIGERNQEEL